MIRPRHGCAAMFGLLVSLAAARGQPALPDQPTIQSFSGQFIVSSQPDAAPWLHKISARDNTNVIHWEPALLAIAAERFRACLWQELDLKPDAPWIGKIYLALFPTRSLGETVTIASSPFGNRWDYRVEMPDTLLNTRYARALSSVLLLEFANRNARADGRAAEIPPWLVDGFARQVMALDREAVIVTPPTARKDGLPTGRFDVAKRGFDAFAAARPILQNSPVLTFDQLSWPTDDQLNGADGNVYAASAQLFLSDLLALKNGPEKLRAMLTALPAHYNWQMAFFAAFAEDFKTPLDVEKWWALRIVNFSASASGPIWTVAASQDRLEQLLRVPAEYRSDSNALPVHVDISLQAALKNLAPEQRDLVLRLRLRDIAMAELRLATPFGALAEGYRSALADFLGEMQKPAPVQAVPDIHAKPEPVVARNFRPGIAETVKKLNDLDSRRREIENRLAAIAAPESSNSGALRH